MQWTCPLCALSLNVNGASYTCANAHTFDLASAGYLNLLPAQNKRSKNPGDSRPMLQARRRFLEAGHYDPLVRAVATHLTSGAWLDLGCGEGYYSRQLPGPSWLALDIAKDGVMMAAKRGESGRFAVASAARLPIANTSLDGVLCVFSPIYADELVRTLKPGGKLIWVGPAPLHLRALAHAVYDVVKDHEATPPSHAELVLEDTQAVSFSLNVQPHEQLDLLSMTPYAWSADEAKTQRIGEISLNGLAADFTIQIFRKR